MKKGLFILLAMLFYVPFAFIVMLSVANNWRYPLLLPESFNLETWAYIVQTDPAVLYSFGLSVLVSFIVASLATIVGFFIGKVIAMHPRKKVFLTITYFPYAFSPVVYAFCLYFFFIRMDWAGSIPGVVLAQLIITFPFAILLFTNHWSHNLANLENLVLTLGGTPRQVFWKVILPVSKNILLIGFFQTFLISWFEYGLTSVIGMGKVQTLTVKTYQFVGEANIYFAALASALLVFPPLILLWFNRRFVFSDV